MASRIKLLGSLALAGTLLLANAAHARPEGQKKNSRYGNERTASYQLASNDQQERRKNRGDQRDEKARQEQRAPDQDARRNASQQGREKQVRKQTQPRPADGKSQDAPRRYQTSAEDHRRLQQREREFRSLSSEEQQRLRAAEQRYQQLDPRQREDLRRQWERMSESERERYRQRIERSD